MGHKQRWQMLTDTVLICLAYLFVNKVIDYRGKKNHIADGADWQVLLFRPPLLKVGIQTLYAGARSVTVQCLLN